jgi:hypothetical protein
MLGTLILIAVVLVAAVLVYHAGMSAARRASGGAGISVSGASVEAFPGGAFVTLVVTNTGSAPGYVSVALYQGGSRVFQSPSTFGPLYPGQSAILNYTLTTPLQPGSQCTVSATITAPAGTATSSATVTVAP